MSFNEILNDTINSLMEDYWKRVSKKHDISVDSLRKLWNKKSKSKSSTKSKVSTKSTSKADFTSDLSPLRLSKCTVLELKELCRAHGHKVGGKKQELIERLQSAPVEKKKKAKKNNRAVESLDVVKKLTAETTAISVRRNAFGNFEHPPTSLVLNNKTKKVYGKQNDDGTVSDLTDDDIENCKKYKLEYDIPTNLDENKTDENIVIEDSEIDSDSESEILSESEEEIEEEEEEEEDSD